MTVFRVIIIAVLMTVFCSHSLAEPKQDSPAGQTIRGIDGGGGIDQPLSVDLTVTAPGNPKDDSLKPAWIIQLCSALSDARYYFMICN